MPELLIVPVVLTSISVAAVPSATVNVCPTLIVSVPSTVRSSAETSDVTVTTSPARTIIPDELASSGGTSAAVPSHVIPSVDVSHVDARFQSALAWLR